MQRRRQPARGAARRAGPHHGGARHRQGALRLGPANCGATARCPTPSPIRPGLANVRDAIPFPRTPGNARYWSVGVQRSRQRSPSTYPPSTGRD